jgi:hypothetical protein
LYYTPKHALVFGGWIERCNASCDACIAHHEIIAEFLAMHLMHKRRKMSGQAQAVLDVQEMSVVLNLTITSTDNIRSHPTMYLNMSRIFSIRFTESKSVQKHEPQQNDVEATYNTNV